MTCDPINFYFLSSGCCGTRFYHHVLRLASNAEVWHQPGHEDIAEIERLMDPERRRRIDEALRREGYKFVSVDLRGYRTGSLNPT